MRREIRKYIGEWLLRKAFEIMPDYKLKDELAKFIIKNI